MIEYENRIRAYSTPDKIFRYFATINLRDPDMGVSNIYMTPDDFLRSMTPGAMQPPSYGLDRFMNITLEASRGEGEGGRGGEGRRRGGREGVVFEYVYVC